MDRVISVVSNIEPFDTRSFPLGKMCVRARSKFENVIFCVLVLARCSNQMKFLQFLALQCCVEHRTVRYSLVPARKSVRSCTLEVRICHFLFARTRSILERFAFDTTLFTKNFICFENISLCNLVCDLGTPRLYVPYQSHSAIRLFAIPNSLATV